MTAVATIVALVPSKIVADAWSFELKTVPGTLTFALPGIFIYRTCRSRFGSQAPAPCAGDVITNSCSSN